ncbi:MAG: N-acetylglucosamine-6-phosphate deacetylase [Ilumatobacteraceae bacterium]
MAPNAYIGGEAIVDGRLRRADVVVTDGHISAIADPGTLDLTGIETTDCTGTIIAPGYIDLQCNGAGGVDLTTQPERLFDVARFLPRFGVTAFLPTVVTSPIATRRRATDAMAAARSTDNADNADTDTDTDTDTDGDRVGAVMLGLHFEGPTISIDHLGAHSRAHVAVPEPSEVDDWIRSGAVRLVTLAPEVDGATDLIDRLVGAGIVVSTGHTAMTPEVFADARHRGASYVTHLFNAMAAFNHRSPGPIGAVLADDSVTVGLICDGIHVDPVAVRLAWQSLGPTRLSLVSDAAAPLGAPFGTFHLGKFEVIYDETGVRTTAGVLAGSALALDQAVRNLVEFTGCTLLDAIATVTTTPADLLGLTDRGRIAVGNHADLTIVDDRGALVATVIAGTTAWTS